MRSPKRKTQTGRRGEFALIAELFEPLAGDGAKLDDDAACLRPPPGKEIVVSTDSYAGGVHFLRDDPPDLIGEKVLRASLSDLAAMGAQSWVYFLNAAFPARTPLAWMRGFAAGLGRAQQRYGLKLAGGDTIAAPSAALFSVTQIGLAAKGKALTRRGMKPGDEIYVSGTLGDAALGLRILRKRLAHVPEEEDRFAQELIARCRLPSPRLELGGKLAGVASAAMDISDGLAADLGHMCRASGAGAEIETARLPFSAAALALKPGRGDLHRAALSGGDDYELLFAAPADRRAAVAKRAACAGTPVTRIGRVVAAPGVQLVDARGRRRRFSGRGGYEHDFS